ncbi:MAG: hypothetical protein AAFQ43_04715, partial [Bacteroidota bacterium]
MTTGEVGHHEHALVSPQAYPVASRPNLWRQRPEARPLQTRAVEFTARADLSRRTWAPLQAAARGFSREALDADPATMGGMLVLASGEKSREAVWQRTAPEASGGSGCPYRSPLGTFIGSDGRSTITRRGPRGPSTKRTGSLGGSVPCTMTSVPGRRRVSSSVQPQSQRASASTRR